MFSKQNLVDTSNKNNIFSVLCVLVALATARPAENEYEYEDEPAPAPKKPVGRPLIGRRNPLASKNNKATSTTTTTTTEAPAQVSLVIFKLGLGLTA